MKNIHTLAITRLHEAAWEHMGNERVLKEITFSIMVVTFEMEANHVSQ